ncbi:transposase [Pelagibius sp. CAU 1746]|uniref:transposase n=1 Tax=Pelagibius sp. CAU 1746 TaxID=3140370 RepID=UPI00325A64B1
MARLARVVIPNLPHHVTQRGNGRAQTFFSDDDYRLYLDLLRKHCTEAEVSIWAWVLMPNHVHLILTPQDADGIRRALSKVHRAYAGHVHARLQKTGHFWQGRFGCVPMDEAHLEAALRYVALNPVRARLAKRAVDWQWSSVHDQLSRKRSGTLTDTAPVRERYPNFAALIEAGEDEDLSMALRRAESIGRPLGNAAFVETLERQTGRTLQPAKRGPKPQQAQKLER